jgi:hypothetical protein
MGLITSIRTIWAQSVPPSPAAVAKVLALSRFSAWRFTARVRFSYMHHEGITQLASQSAGLVSHIGRLRPRRYRTVRRTVLLHTPALGRPIPTSSASCWMVPCQNRSALARGGLRLGFDPLHHMVTRKKKMSKDIFFFRGTP